MDAGSEVKLTPLHLAKMEVVENLNPNATNRNKSTPLHLACQEGNFQCVEHLLKNGKVDPNARDENESTPLHLCL